MNKSSQLFIIGALALLTALGFPFFESWLAQYASPSSGIWFWTSFLQGILWSCIAILSAYLLIATLCPTPTND